MIGLRAAADLRQRIERWAKAQGDDPSLSEAVRRLIEIGLVAAPRKGARARKQAAKAEKMASDAVDRQLAGKGLSKGTKATRRGRLMAKPNQLK